MVLSNIIYTINSRDTCNRCIQTVIFHPLEYLIRSLHSIPFGQEFFFSRYFRSRFKLLPFLGSMDHMLLTTTSVVVMGLSQLFFCILTMQGWHHLAATSWWAVLLLIILTTVIIGSFLILLLHEQNVSFVTFQVSNVI